MKLNEMTKEELQTLSYTDLTDKILKETKKAMTTPALFKEICNLLEYTEAEYESKIGDYYTELTLDKRFALLDSHEWDLRERHAIKIEVEEEEEEIVEETEEELNDEEENENIEDDIDNDLDDADDDLDDMSIIGDDEEDEM